MTRKISIYLKLLPQELERLAEECSITMFYAACPISFEFQNYTVVTSQCRGPQYPAKQCCEALTEFACPFVDFLNDLSNDCASTMFSYINLHGKYPPGLFASECKGDKNGLACPDLAPSESANANNSQMSCRLSPMLMIATSLIGLLLLLL